MDGKFLLATALLAATGFGGVWFATAPAASEEPARPRFAAAPEQTAAKPRRRLMLEAPPEDTQPVPAFAGAAPRRSGRAVSGSSDVYYRDCNAARAAGAAPIYRDEPGYRPQMDGDNDGIACEPHRY